MNDVSLKSACDQAQAGLWVQFWDGEDGIFRHRLPWERDEHFIYWWHAHVIDVLLDGYLRTNGKEYLDRICQELAGAWKKNGSTLLNNWYDDMEWMALALLRVWDATRDDRFADQVRILWEDIKTAWNTEMGGGMAWKKDQPDYKNTPANAPAAILALRLYQRFGRPEDLEWGKRIYQWNLDNLVDPETDFVWDGMNRRGDGKIDFEWEFTYCQGVMLGAALELWRITGERAYLEQSIRTAREAKRRLCDCHGGIFPYEGKDDCGLFRGILMRYFRELLRECPELTDLREMLLINARTAAARGMDGCGLIGGSWDSLPGGQVDLAQHLSGMMVLEMAEALGEC